MSPGQTRRPWKYKEEAAAFLDAHRDAYGRADYAPVFFGVLDRAMSDPKLPPVCRALFSGFRFAWGHLVDEAVDSFPKKDPTDKEPKRLTQKRLAELIGMPESTFSQTATFLREERYWHPTTESVYPDDQRSPSLFAAQHAPRSAAALKHPPDGAAPDFAPPNVFASSSPDRRAELYALWYADHPQIQRREGEIRARKLELRDEGKQLTAEQKGYEHQRLKWVERQILREQRAAAGAPNSPPPQTAAAGAEPTTTHEAATSDPAEPPFAEPEPSSQSAPVRAPGGERFAPLADEIRPLRTEIRPIRTSEAPNPNPVNADPQVPVNALPITDTELETTTTMEADSVVVVEQALKAFGSITPPAARKFWESCRQQSPQCSAEDVAVVIHQVGRTIGANIRNPVGLLITTVPQTIAAYVASKPTPPPPPRPPTREEQVQDLAITMKLVAEMPNHINAEEFRRQIAEAQSRAPDLYAEASRLLDNQAEGADEHPLPNKPVKGKMKALINVADFCNAGLGDRERL